MEICHFYDLNRLLLLVLLLVLVLLLLFVLFLFNWISEQHSPCVKIIWSCLFGENMMKKRHIICQHFIFRRETEKENGAANEARSSKKKLKFITFEMNLSTKCAFLTFRSLFQTGHGCALHGMRLPLKFIYVYTYTKITLNC